MNDHHRLDPAMLSLDSVVETRYWHSLDKDRVQCDLCPRYCRLGEGQRGFCFVRGNIGGKVVMTSYGRSSGYCIDPIEKKPLNHFLPGTPVLSFGTAGCNLGCKYCQNWDISKSHEIDILADAASPETIAHAAVQTGSRSVAYTYNDPIVFHEYAIDVAKACREQNIRSVAVTSGYVCEAPRREFYQYMDAANVDLKAFTEAFYYKLTGGHLQPVLDTILYLRHETNVWLELTTLLIPGWNDSDEEIDAMTRWLVRELGPEVPLHLSAFHPDWKMRDVPPTPLASLQRARDIAIKNGVYYAYTGNVHDKARQSTWCHHCELCLIGRDWYQLSEWNLDSKGRCTRCGARCAGVFEAAHGDWGGRSQPIRLSDVAVNSRRSVR